MRLSTPNLTNHLTKRHGLIVVSLLAVVILSLGTVSAAYYNGGAHQSSQSKVVVPKQVTLVDGDKKITLTPTELGWAGGKFNQTTLEKKVDEVAAGLQQPATDAKIVSQNGNYVISPSANGSQVDTAKAAKMIKAAVFAGKTSVTLPVAAVVPAVTEASLQPQLQQLKAQQAAKAQTAAAKPATARSCADNPAGRQLILVSLSQQHLWACSGASQVYDTAITSGAYLAGMATPTGTWHIYSKTTNTHLVGPGYDYPVNYWVPFYSDYGFHDSSWQAFPYGSPQYASDGSHGCIHVPLGAMTWLYSWAPVGTTVTITG